jgi:hypothetical protein
MLPYLSICFDIFFIDNYEDLIYSFSKISGRRWRGMEELFTIPETAGKTRMSQAWWRGKVFRQEIKFVKIGRRVFIPKSTIDDLFKNSIREPKK